MPEYKDVRFSNAETIEIVLDGNRKQYYFSQLVELLKGKKIIDIDIIASQGNVTIKAPSGNNIANISSLVSGYITLNVKSKEVVKNLNLASLSRVNVPFRPFFDNLEPDWAKSYIMLADGAGNAGESILLTIYFND